MKSFAAAKVLVPRRPKRNRVDSCVLQSPAVAQLLFSGKSETVPSTPVATAGAAAGPDSVVKQIHFSAVTGAPTPMSQDSQVRTRVIHLLRDFSLLNLLSL